MLSRYSRMLWRYNLARYGRLKPSRERLNAVAKRSAKALAERMA